MNNIQELTPQPLGHVHTLKRILNKGKRTDIFQCTHPNCHYERKADHLVGKAAKCPYCPNDFVVTRFKLRKQGLLHCDACSIRKKKKTIEAPMLEERLEKFLKEVS